MIRQSSTFGQSPRAASAVSRFACDVISTFERLTGSLARQAARLRISRTLSPGGGWDPRRQPAEGAHVSGPARHSTRRSSRDVGGAKYSPSDACVYANRLFRPTRDGREAPTPKGRLWVELTRSQLVSGTVATVKGFGRRPLRGRGCGLEGRRPKASKGGNRGSGEPLGATRWLVLSVRRWKVSRVRSRVGAPRSRVR